MNKDLGMTQAQFGIASGIFFIGYLIFEIPSNYALAKFGGRVWLARIMISWGVISVAAGFVRNFSDLAIVRTVLGIAEAGSFPGMLYFIALWFPRELRGRVMVVCVLPLAVVFGTPVSTGILQYMDGLFGLAGWRLLFMIEGLPAILVGFALLKYLTSRPADATWLSPAQREWLIGVSLDGGQPASHAGSSMWAVMRNPQVVLFALAYACLMCGLNANFFFAPQIISAFGKLVHAKLSYMEIGLLTSVPSCFAVVISYLWARHSDRTGERVLHVAGAAIGAAIGLVILANAASFVTLLLGLALLGGCVVGGASAVLQLPTRGMADKPAAITFAFVNSVSVLFSSLIPYVMGKMTDVTGSYVAALYLIGGLMVLAAVLVVVGGYFFERRDELPNARLQETA
ncbi:MAG TPA: MFS transporter, partial [Burkholderiaceae bacterium]